MVYNYTRVIDKQRRFNMIEKSGADKSIKKAGIIGAVVGGLALATFALVGIFAASATFSFLLWVLSAFLALVVGGAIGGGLGVWISEINRKN